jgi:hypothetical protein
MVQLLGILSFAISGWLRLYTMYSAMYFQVVVNSVIIGQTKCV